MNTIEPFHLHEKIVQNMFHVAEQAWELGTAMIEDHISAPFIPFLRSQPFLFLSYVDVSKPSNTSETKDFPAWATMIHGDLGFVQVSLDGSDIIIQRAKIATSDTLLQTVAREKVIPMAIMVIDFERRRRFRINGTGKMFKVERNHPLSADNTLISFHLQVKEAYGNCPKYIQSRRIVPLPPSSPVKPRRSPSPPQPLPQETTFTASQMDLIEQCDTFFLSSYYMNDVRSPLDTVKADITHRGGNSGFIRILNERTLIWPEYQGNNMFMTLGNIHGNKKIGLLLIDFLHRRFLKLSGDARLITTTSSPSPYSNSGNGQRMDDSNVFVEFIVKEVIQEVSFHLPFSFELIQPSPYNPPITGFITSTVSKSSSAALKVGSAVQSSEPLALTEVIPWSDDVASFRFYLPENNEKKFDYLPGQYIMIRWIIQSLSFDGVRSWTITSLPTSGLSVSSSSSLINNNINNQEEKEIIQITIKKSGVITSWLFDLFYRLNSLEIEKKWNDLIQSKELKCELIGINGDFTLFESIERIKKDDDRLSFQAKKIEKKEEKKEEDNDHDLPHFLFFSGGIGMTPFITMIKGLYSLKRMDREKIQLKWFLSIRNIDEMNALLDLQSFLRPLRCINIEIYLYVTDPSSAVNGLYYAETINQYCQFHDRRMGIRVVAIHYGRITEESIIGHCDDVGGAEVYLCGPMGFMRDIELLLPNIVHVNHVHKEDFFF